MMSSENRKLFTSSKIFTLIILTMAMGGCASSPTLPILGVNQTLTSDGQIQSKQGDYVVRVSKMDTKSADYREISQYGLPIRVTVANLGKKKFTFGPEQVKLIKNGKTINALTVDALEEIKKKKDRNDAIFAGAMGALAFSAGLVGALSGDAALAQSTQQQMADSMTLTINNYGQSTKYTENTISALSQQVTSSALNRTELKQKEVVDGLVFFEQVKTSDVITVIVQTENIEHKVVFQK